MRTRACHWRLERRSRARQCLATLAPLLPLLLLFLLPAPARAQGLNPVYTDDSAVARDTLARVAEFIAGGNEAGAVRELQRLLDEQPDRVVALPAGGGGEGAAPDTYVGVRDRVHAMLLAQPGLLERYRAAEGPRAQQDLEAGPNGAEAVERARLLTPAGLEAALRVAQLRLEARSFEAARLALEQLETHPDRRPPPAPGAPAPPGAGAADSAAMLALVAAYLDRPEVWERAERWAREAGLPPPRRQTVERPLALRLPVAALSGAPGPATVAGLPSQPLWSARLEALAAPEPQLVPTDDDAGGGGGGAGSTAGWVQPLVVGDTLFINDGTALSARDRFTLQVRWARKTAGEDVPAAFRSNFRAGPAFEEILTLAAQGRTLVAATGGARGNFDPGIDPVVQAFDAGSGRLLWASALSRLDPQLEGVSVRGAPLIDGATVIVWARKSSQGRRIATSYLVGINLEDGSLRWVRPVASAGAYPWGQNRARALDTCLLHHGVVYCSDGLGAVAAVEAGTGRPRWVRTMPTPAGMGMMVETWHTWQWSAPVAAPDGATVIALSPDRAEILRLDAATGETVGRRAAGALGDPAYLLRVEGHLAAVGRESVVIVPLDNLEGGTPQRTRPVPGGIVGRVVPVGGKLLVPRLDGVALIDPANPTAEAAVATLERPGNALPLESQVLVVDARQVHSYLAWEVAERLLEERMAASPADAEPAITYAELAYRAGRHQRIAPAADRALEAIDKAGASEGARASRTRLFTVLRDMAEHTQAKWEAGRAAPRPDGAPPEPPLPARQDAQVRRRGPALAQRPAPDLPVLDLPVLALVVERLGRAARGADERVTHLMALGRLHEAQDKHALAVESYQRILGEPALARAAWRGPGVSVLAELESTRRIRQVVMERGKAAYAAFESQADLELTGLGPLAPPEALERVGRQFPAAAAGAAAWMRAADLHEAAGRSHAAVADLREGLASAETAHAAGALPDPRALGEIAGRLVVRLQRLDQYFAAAQLLTRIRAQYPAVPLLERGTELDTASLADELVRRLASLQRLARIGPALRPEAQPLASWQIMAPYLRRSAGAPEHLMMVSYTRARVALWGLAGGAPGEGAGRIQMLWSRDYRGQAPRLLRIDPESVYLLWEREGQDGVFVERIATVTGETRWTTEPFRALFPAEPAMQRRLEILRTIDTPIEGPVRLTDVLVAMDEQALAVVERSGRAAAFDPATGKLLWSATTAVTNVHDIDVAAGALAIAGAAPPPNDPGAEMALRPLALALDARTGREMHRLEDLGGQQARWVRLAADPAAAGAALILGLEAQVQSVDLAKGAVNWTIPGGPAFQSMDAWLLGERLCILDTQRTIWMVHIPTGRMGTQALDTHEHLVGGGAVYAHALGEGQGWRAAFSTARGVCLFDAEGRLVGIDALEGGAAEDGSLVPPVPAEGFFVTADTAPRPGDLGQNVYTIHILESASGLLRESRSVALGLPPKRIAILDGRVLVTAGDNTVVYSAPVDGR